MATNLTTRQGWRGGWDLTRRVRRCCNESFSGQLSIAPTKAGESKQQRRQPAANTSRMPVPSKSHRSAHRCPSPLRARSGIWAARLAQVHLGSSSCSNDCMNSRVLKRHCLMVFPFDSTTSPRNWWKGIPSPAFLIMSCSHQLNSFEKVSWFKTRHAIGLSLHGYVMPRIRTMIRSFDLTNDLKGSCRSEATRMIKNTIFSNLFQHLKNLEKKCVFVCDFKNHLGLFDHQTTLKNIARILYNFYIFEIFKKTHTFVKIGITSGKYFSFSRSLRNSLTIEETSYSEKMSL